MSTLALDVFVAPMRPTPGTPAQGPGDEPMWSPMSATLVHGEHDGVLVDTLMTYDQVDDLAEWVRAKGITPTHVVITHGHTDHWVGIARLQEHFPGLVAVAAAPVVEQARFEATNPHLVGYWQHMFGGDIPAEPTLPTVMTGDALDVEGHEVWVLSLGRGDTVHSTVVHVPDLDAVVAGDIVYNDVHMMMMETDSAGRADWIATLDAIEELHPRVVVAGHKRVGAPDSSDTIEASRRYIRDFDRVAGEQDTVEGIVDATMSLHGDRDNPRVLWHCARIETARRAAAGA